MFDSDSREINKLRIIYRPLSPELMPLLETPEVAKKTRILNKVKYSPTTLAKYSKSIEVKISLLLESVMPNTNSDLRKQVVNDVLRRLNLLLLEDRKEINDQNKAVVSNIKSLITGMRLHVKNDREQNKLEMEWTICYYLKWNTQTTNTEAFWSSSKIMVDYGRGNARAVQ